MIKDIVRPEVEDVAIVVVKEFDEEFLEEMWNAYLVNMKQERIYNILVTSKGYGSIADQKKETSIIRRFYEELPAQSYALIEPIMEELFVLNNEFWVSFYIDGQIYDKKYVFVPESIVPENFTLIPLIGKQGVMIR